MAMKSKSEGLDAKLPMEAVGAVAHDPAKAGYHKLALGGDDAVNYRIEGGMVKKDESPFRAGKAGVAAVGHHSVTGQLYSGDPASHGHGKK